MLYFVGVGPGDPELITMKAVRILQEADAIAIPDSGKNSVVWKIAGKWMDGKPICRLPMPMRGNKEDWADAHRQAAEKLLEWLGQYENIAYPVLGDPGIYASSSYLMKRIEPHHPCKLIPGIPAMCAASAELGMPLCEQGETFLVTDSFSAETDVAAENIVIMKGRGKLTEIKKSFPGCEAYAVRNLGFEDQWVGELNAATDENDSYFTTVLVKNKRS